MSDHRVATILVVDDNPAGRYATSRVLRASGFDVLEAGTGAEGLELAPRAELIILDVNLPDTDGFEVCRRIRANRQTARTPVVHLSATFVKDVDKVQGLESGADGYLTQPVEPPVLVATVNAFLRARRAEEEMRLSDARFKAIFEQAPSGILLVSADLIYLEANPAVCRALGRTRGEIVGRHASAFLPAGHEHDAADIAAELERSGAWRGTVPLLRADGAQVELEWSISRHALPGVSLAVVNDVTERRAHELERERLLAAERAAREEAERANRLKDEFLATLSHELRTPLNAILGWAQILKSPPSPSAEDVREGVDAIERNAQAQAQLIADLLDVARITSGAVRLDARPIDAAAAVRNALATVRPAAEAKGLRLEQALDPGAGHVHADPARLQQVVWNLVTNAVKFTPRGGTIRVALAREGGQVRIAVADDGRGIKADFLPHIFERFRQEDATTRRNQGGLGLGLAIVKNLVEMHGGTITAASAGEGRGATFTVRLPAVAAPAGPPAAVAEGSDGDPAGGSGRGSTPGGAAGVSLRGMRVLVVDDEPDARAVLRRVLARAGADVADAADVPAALAAAARFRPHLLVSDVGMPGQDGRDLVEALRHQGHTAAVLPAVALTAFARDEDRADSLRAGFQAHLAKPVDPHELLAVVAELGHPALMARERAV